MDVGVEGVVADVVDDDLFDLSAKLNDGARQEVVSQRAGQLYPFQTAVDSEYFAHANNDGETAFACAFL